MGRIKDMLSEIRDNPVIGFLNFGANYVEVVIIIYLLWILFVIAVVVYSSGWSSIHLSQIDLISGILIIPPFMKFLSKKSITAGLMQRIGLDRDRVLWIITVALLVVEILLNQFVHPLPFGDITPAAGLVIIITLLITPQDIVAALAEDLRKKQEPEEGVPTRSTDI